MTRKTAKKQPPAPPAATPASLPDPSVPAQIQELLDTDRELTPQEQQTLHTLAATGWAQVTRILARNADRAYATANPEELGHCLFAHMTIEQRAALTLADAYHCPSCGRLLKDRNNPVASAVMLERRRIGEKWSDVEQASPEHREDAMDAFLRSLGYPR